MNQSELVLDVPNGLIHVLIVDDDVLFAGLQVLLFLFWL